MSPFNETDRIEDLASDWVLRRETGLTREEQQELDTWLSADPRHYAAFAAMEGALATVDDARQAGTIETLARNLSAAEGQRRSPFRSAPVWIGVAAVLAIGVFSWQYASRTVRPSEASLATIRPSPAQQRLPDGSLVELNAGADFSTEFTSERRSVRLSRGEAHFSVAKDAARPFVVSIGSIQVRAVGTAFAVKLERDEVGILVTEGRVAVETPVSLSSASEPILIAAGGRLAVPLGIPTATPQAVETISAVEIKAALAWRDARFEFNNTPLPEAIRLFNERGTIKIVIGDPSLNETRISGLYWADDSVVFSRLLENSLDLRAIRKSPDQIILARRP